MASADACSGTYFSVGFGFRKDFLGKYGLLRGKGCTFYGPRGIQEKKISHLSVHWAFSGQRRAGGRRTHVCRNGVLVKRMKGGRDAFGTPFVHSIYPLAECRTARTGDILFSSIFRPHIRWQKGKTHVFFSLPVCRKVVEPCFINKRANSLLHLCRAASFCSADRGRSAP